MSDDGTSGYAPKSPDLSSFYSNPAPSTSASAAPKGYDYDYDSNNTHNYLHNTRRGSYLQPPQRPPTSAWQPKSPASSSPTRATNTFPTQQQQAYDQSHNAFLHHQQGAHPPAAAPPPPQQPQHPHYVPPSPSHHEFNPPQHGGYPYNPVQGVKHAPQASLQQQPQPVFWPAAAAVPAGAQGAPFPGPPSASGTNPYVHRHSHSLSQSSSTSTQPGLHEEHFVSPTTGTMPPRRAAAAAAAESLGGSGAGPETGNGPIVKTKFPTARIKRIMQADEEVGKVAQSTPIAVGKALEMFMIQLVTRSADQARQKGSKRVSAQMLKDVIEGDDQWDFLREIAAKVEENEKKGRGAAKTEGSESDEEAPPAEGKRKGRGRKKKSG